MGPPRRKLQETVQATLHPPDALQGGQHIAQIVGAAGNNLYHAKNPSSETVLVELEAKFRSTIWLKRGSFVVVDTTTLADRDNKLAGEIVNIIRDEKAWRKASYWPSQFPKKSTASDEGDATAKMPPSEEEDG